LQNVSFIIYASTNGWGSRLHDATVVSEVRSSEEAINNDEDRFKTGTDRATTALDWGAVSVPRQTAPGARLDVQVAFATEAMTTRQVLQIDLHGIVDGKRVPGIARATPIQITPGVTKPYEAIITVPSLNNLTGVTVVIYTSPDGRYENRVLTTETQVPFATSGNTK
jgi:hypothetical protein